MPFFPPLCVLCTQLYPCWHQHVLPACLTLAAFPSASNHGGDCAQRTVAFCPQEEAQSSFQGAAMSPGVGSSALNKRSLPALQKTESVPDIVMAAAQVSTCSPASWSEGIASGSLSRCMELATCPAVCHEPLGCWSAGCGRGGPPGRCSAAAG